MDKLVAFLSPEVTSELADSVFSDVDAEGWARFRAKDSETRLDAFVAPGPPQTERAIDNPDEQT